MVREINPNVKSQVTVFVIMALILIMLVSLMVFLKGQKDDDMFGRSSLLQKLGFKTDVDAVKNGISVCGLSSARNAVKKIGLQGGYYKAPKLNMDLGWAFIPFYYYRGDFLMPSKQDIEGQLGLFVDETIHNCIDDVNVNNYKLEYRNPKTKVTILPGKVKFVMDIPMTISRGDEVVALELKDYPVVVNSSLYEIYEIADYITKSHKEDDSMMCINCITDMARQRNVYVDFIDYQDLTTLVQISENRTYVEPYLFEFMNRY